MPIIEENGKMCLKRDDQSNKPITNWAPRIIGQIQNGEEEIKGFIFKHPSARENPGNKKEKAAKKNN